MRSSGIIMSNSISTMTTTIGSIFPPPPPEAAAMTVQHQSAVVPYLFGGLAAMLGLIALALLILACSYLRHSGSNSERDPEAAGDEKSVKIGNPAPVLKETILVIMAGDLKPTFLATPISGRDSSSFGEKTETEEREKDDESEIPKENDEETQDHQAS